MNKLYLQISPKQVRKSPDSVPYYGIIYLDDNPITKKLGKNEFELKELKLLLNLDYILKEK